MPHAGVCDGRGREGGTANVRLLAQSLREAEHDKWGGTAVCLRPTSTLPTLSARCIALSARCIAHQTRPVQVSPSSYLRIQPWSEPMLGKGAVPTVDPRKAVHSLERHTPANTMCCRTAHHGYAPFPPSPGVAGGRSTVTARVTASPGGAAMSRGNKGFASFVSLACADNPVIACMCARVCPCGCGCGVCVPRRTWL